ncbi:MAG: protein-tyrosine phosphatase family protein [Isosphaeraceae bacterium]
MRRIPEYLLWIGHAGEARGSQEVLQAGITTVVDLALEELPANLVRELIYCRFPLHDGPGNPPWLLRAAVETVAALLRANVPILVACGAGMSRSLCIAGAAIALVRGCPADEGLAIAIGTGPARADVSPALWAQVRAVFA